MTTRSRLAAEPLESREVPAVHVAIDYSYDSSGFFADPTRRAVMEQAAADLGGRIDTPLAAVVPGGTGNWTEYFSDPTTGADAGVRNATLPADTLVVYVGARSMSSVELGEGGPGTYSASGGLKGVLAYRAPAGVTAWGGNVTFNSGTNWYFGSSAAGVGRSQTDFYSVAVHELGHILGIGTADRWYAQVSGGSFVGPYAEAVYGGPVPLTSDGSHWADGTSVNGQPASLDPAVGPGVRVPFSPLDYAALQDLGWTVGASAGPAPVATTLVNTHPWSGTWTSLAGRQVVVLSGAAVGTAQAYVEAADGTLTPVGPVLTPFLSAGGPLRAAVGDFNGDGTPDLALGTGPGSTAGVRIFNGRTGADLGAATEVLDGFGGGVYLAAGDLDHDGRAELAVSADAGGGTRVTVFKVATRLSVAADFIALDDPNFRGGSRVAIGDVNHDGSADLIVGAGIGGGPRVAVYDGRSVVGGSPAKLIPDFFALDPTLRSGVFVTAADLDGDGYADLAYGTGTTGGPRIRIVSGQLLMANPGTPADALPAVADFFALNSDDRNGLRVAARDLDGDGKAELVVGSGAAGTARARVLTLADITDGDGPSSTVFNPFPGVAALDGVYVG